MSSERELSNRKRALVHLAWFAAFVLTYRHPCTAQGAAQFHKTFVMSVAEPVSLNVHLWEGDLQIAYSHEGEVSIVAQAQPDNETSVIPADFFSQLLVVSATNNRIELRQQRHSGTLDGAANIRYRIDVPYRTEVWSSLNSGNQAITGVMGPVTAVSDRGDIHVSYVPKAVSAETGTGNLFLEVIGERVDARTRVGNISCIRIAQGVNAETGDGDISLMVVGPATASVKHGAGRIDAAGVRGTLVASTDAGDLHVKAVPHDEWRLSSVSGTIRAELPPAAKFDLDALTNSGELTIARNDVEAPNAGVRSLNQKANGGGKRIEIRTASGRIVVA